MRCAQITAMVLSCLAAACGGEGSGGISPPPTATSPTPPTASTPSPPVTFVLQYPGPQVFTVGAPASSDVPLLNFVGPYAISVSPPLPAGLEIDTNTGAISGTPTAVTAAASYSVSVQDAVGENAQTSVVIEVNEGPLFYSSPAILVVGSAIAPLSPRGASGTASYTVAPPLPKGLAIDPASGTISGTPISAQSASYYEVSRAEALLTLKFGLTLVIGVSSPGPIAVSTASTLRCAYSGGFIGTYVGNSQANDEGLVAIAFTPDGNALARVLDLSDNAAHDSDALPGLSPNLDGSFDINFTANSPGSHLSGHFYGPDLIFGTYESNGEAKPFQASRLGGYATAEIRYTGGFGSDNGYRVDFGVLDRTGNVGTGIGYQFGEVGSGYRLINRQLAITGTFADNVLTWSIPGDDISGVDTQSSTGLNLAFGDPYDALFFAQTIGCQLN